MNLIILLYIFFSGSELFSCFVHVLNFVNFSVQLSTNIYIGLFLLLAHQADVLGRDAIEGQRLVLNGHARHCVLVAVRAKIVSVRSAVRFVGVLFVVVVLVVLVAIVAAVAVVALEARAACFVAIVAVGGVRRRMPLLAVYILKVRN